MQKTTSFSYQVFIGIDISKSWFDVSIWIPGRSLLLHRQLANNKTGFIQLWKWVKKHIGPPVDSWLFCMEATGLYTRSLVHYLLAKSVDVWIASGLDISRSLGLSRGKNDKVDSQRIAQYAATHVQNRRLVSLSQLSLEKLQDLQALRQRLIKSKTGLSLAVNELKAVDPKNGKLIEKCNRQALAGIGKSLEQTEKMIAQTIEQDQELDKKFKLAQSVKGVGKVLALQLVLATHGFTRMMNARKLACHAGVAPFEHQSGTSIKGKSGVSKFANHSLKKVLHMAAISASKHDPELKAYFLRKVEQGKHKMSVINAIRNKLLHRVIAVINRGYPFIDFSALDT